VSQIPHYSLTRRWLFCEIRIFCYTADQPHVNIFSDKAVDTDHQTKKIAGTDVRLWLVGWRLTRMLGSGIYCSGPGAWVQFGYGWRRAHASGLLALGAQGTGVGGRHTDALLDESMPGITARGMGWPDRH